mmetsp:Transcript_6193/g.10357  ORF Transcript_6193/g.10357 Transcript_6193/m.10357 type:complete len:351 (+) Transcript_6193:652-1704(+)
MRSMSESVRRPRSALMSALACAPVTLSIAVTDRMPLASREKVTSTFGSPLLARCTPEILNSPSLLLAEVCGRSPSKTTTSISVCQSSQVVYSRDFTQGMAVFRGMSTDITLPSNSIPRDRGVTSSSTRSELMPSRAAPPPLPPAFRMAPCTAAPYATASSGLIDLHNSTRPSNSPVSISCRHGMRVEPPTSTTSLTVSKVAPASRITDFTVSMQRVNRPLHIFSKIGRVIVAVKFSPSMRASRSISVSLVLDSARFAASTALRSRWVERWLLFTALAAFLPCFSSICFKHQSTKQLSKSSPPRWVSPPVAFTANTPPSIDRTLTSKVPPPRSKITTLGLSCLAAPSTPEV